MKLTKLHRINELFFNNIGRPFTSSALHELFGSSFRSRVSDINKRSWYISIFNGTKDGVSVYWSEETVLKWLPKSKLSAPSALKLREAVKRAKKLIAENK